MSKWHWYLMQFTRLLWVRATLIGVLGVGAVGLAALIERLFAGGIGFEVSADTIDSILTILASSMLTVTTFSLSVMTSAFGLATSNVTPRATRLLAEDRVTQNVLSTFIGSFLFSIVGIVALKAGAYSSQGRVVLFAVTVFVLILIVISLIRWIDQLTRLGRVNETTDRVEETALSSIKQRLKEPFLGGCARTEDANVPDDSCEVFAERTGYVQHIDMKQLSEAAKTLNADILLDVVPGSFIYQNARLAAVVPDSGNLPEETRQDVAVDVRRAITIGEERSFDQDPRFGLVVLSEIACRALSPGVNDSGTAIDVIGRIARLLILWGNGSEKFAQETRFPRIFVPPINASDIFEDGFQLIERDAAAVVEVQVRLRKALQALSRLGNSEFREAARKQAAIAAERAEIALNLEYDKQQLRNIEIN